MSRLIKPDFLIFIFLSCTGCTLKINAPLPLTSSNQTSKSNIELGEWTWLSGSSTGINLEGNDSVSPYQPGSRSYIGGNWVDSSGNYYLFGGNGTDTANNVGELNDFWEYSGGLWNLISGSPTRNQISTYGQPGTPGARYESASATNPASGHFFLFGGNGYDHTAYGILGDLWEYTGTQWNWIAASNSVKNTLGVYGSGAGHAPGGRYWSCMAMDSSNNLWIYGGDGYGSAGGAGYLADLWKYNATTQLFSFVTGSSSTGTANTVYGIQGVSSASNTLGARARGACWVDTAGNFWYFGGSDGTYTYNDLWKYDGSNWTWVSGTNSPTATGPSGVYGTQSVGASSNMPGARAGMEYWKDLEGRFWLFGEMVRTSTARREIFKIFGLMMAQTGFGWEARN